MRAVLVGVLALHLIIVPVIFQSCCGGLSGDDAYYDIDDMSLTLYYHNPGSVTTGPPSMLSNLDFLITFQVTRAALETMNGSALYACSPAPEISNQKVAAILITSNNDLLTAAGTIVAGENLNFLFLVDATGHRKDPLSDLINNPLLDLYLSFTSSTVLSAAQSQIFTFKITLDDGRVFTLQTQALQLLEG